MATKKKPNHEYISMLQLKCGCDISYGGGIELGYCPLHAAAPELLEALKALASMSDEPTPEPETEWERAVNAAHRAIAKAEGREPGSESTPRKSSELGRSKTEDPNGD